MSYYSGTVIDGPRAGRWLQSSEDSTTLDGVRYRHRVLVSFKGAAQEFSAWVPASMKTTVALQKIFDGYAEWAKGDAK